MGVTGITWMKLPLVNVTFLQKSVPDRYVSTHFSSLLPPNGIYSSHLRKDLVKPQPVKHQNDISVQKDVR